MAFANESWLVHQVSRHPERCLEVLDGLLSKEQADAFEAAFAPDNAMKLGQLRNARGWMLNAQLAGDSAAVAELDTEIAALVASIEGG